jgi:hypothetical protein
VDFEKLTHTERTIMKLKQLLLIILFLVIFNASAQMGGGGSSRGQSIPSDSGSGKNNIELMQQEMMGAIVITCQENINKDCAINEKVKSIVNSACGKEKSKELKDGCFTIAEQILSSLVNNPNSQESQIYKKIYNEQPHIIEKIKKQNDEEESKRALIKKDQDEKDEENKRALIKKQQEEIENSKLAVSETGQSTGSSKDRYQANRDTIAGATSSSKYEKTFIDKLMTVLISLCLYAAGMYLAYKGRWLTSGSSSTFSIKTGFLHRVGAMETSRKRVYNSITEKYDVETSRTISLIKIGDETLTNIDIGGADRAIFDILQPGNNAAIILMKMLFTDECIVYAVDIDEKIESERRNYNITFWNAAVLISLVIGMFMFLNSAEASLIFSFVFIFICLFSSWAKNGQQNFDRTYEELRNHIN